MLFTDSIHNQNWKAQLEKLIHFKQLKGKNSFWEKHSILCYRELIFYNVYVNTKYISVTKTANIKIMIVLWTRSQTFCS